MAFDPLVVVSYDPAWPGLFAELGHRLRLSLGDTASRVDHIGSTAVPRLDAKPIIDIQVSVRSLEPIEGFQGAIERCGFVWRPDNPDLTKRYFREAEGARRTHLHARRAGSFSEQYSLLFRDYLRVHHERAAEYAALKHALAEPYRDDREGYVVAKGPFIWETMQMADEWAQQTGWEPGPTDA